MPTCCRSYPRSSAAAVNLPRTPEYLAAVHEKYQEAQASAAVLWEGLANSVAKGATFELSGHSGASGPSISHALRGTRLPTWGDARSSPASRVLVSLAVVRLISGSSPSIRSGPRLGTSTRGTDPNPEKEFRRTAPLAPGRSPTETIGESSRALPHLIRQPQGPSKRDACNLDCSHGLVS
jgi:hypothetical protein